MKTDSREQLFATVFESDDIDPETVRQAIRTHADDLKRQELQTAFDRLEARRTLTPEQRQIIIQMATAIVDGVLAAPEETLEDATECDREIVRTAVELFDSDR